MPNFQQTGFQSVFHPTWQNTFGPYPAWSANFAAGEFPGNITFTRPSNAWDFVGNTLTQFSSNVPRVTSRGFLIEGARTNHFTNANMGGAVVGTPGTLPTNVAVELAAGISTNVVGVGTEDGLNYVDIQFVGTPTGTFYQLRSNTINPGGAVGDTFASSCFARVVGGSLTNISSNSFGITEATGAFPGTFTSINTAATRLSESRVSSAHTTTLTGTALQLRFRLGLTIGNAIDITVRFAGWQLETGAFASSPIITTGTAATRAADSAVVTNLASLQYNPAQGTVVATSSFTSSATTFQVLWSFNDATTSNYVRVINSTSAALEGNLRAGGVDTAFVTRSSLTLANTTTSALSWINNSANLAAAGIVGTEDTSVTVPTVTRMQLGLSTASIPWFGVMQRIAYYNTQLPAAKLQSLTV